MSGECVFLGSVSSQQRFGVMDIKALGMSQLWGLGQTVLQLRVTALFYLENSRKIRPGGMRACWPKDAKRRAPQCVGEREGDPQALGSYFSTVFLPLGLLCVHWASEECCLCPWGPHSGPRTFLCSIFVSLSCLLATAIWTLVSCSNYLTLLSFPPLTRILHSCEKQSSAVRLTCGPNLALWT